MTDGAPNGDGAVEIGGRRAAVTGGGGFIGAAICRRLAAEGATVSALEVDRAAAERVRGAGATFVECDVRNPEATERALEGAEIVVHTAAYVREWGSMEDFVELNVGGTVNVLDAAERHGAERVVHVSSVVVYGYEDEREQDESATRRAVGIPYIDTKSASDRIACRRGAVVVRPGDVYGPGSVPWAIRPVELARSGQLAVPRPGDGRMLPLYIDDLAEAIVLAIRRGQPGRVYTVWDGQAVSFGEMFDRYAEIAGAGRARRLPRGVLKAAAGAAEVGARLLGRPPAMGRHGVTFVDRRGTASNRRAREELGWGPRVDLAEGLRRTREWLRAEGHLDGR